MCICSCNQGQWFKKFVLESKCFNTGFTPFDKRRAAFGNYLDQIVAHASKLNVSSLVCIKFVVSVVLYFFIVTKGEGLVVV